MSKPELKQRSDVWPDRTPITAYDIRNRFALHNLNYEYSKNNYFKKTVKIKRTIKQQLLALLSWLTSFFK